MPNHATTIEELFDFLKENMASKDDLRNFATKDDLEAFAKRYDFESFATKDDLEAFAKRYDFESFATKDDLNAFAKKDDIGKFATKDDVFSVKVELQESIDYLAIEMNAMENRLITHIDGLTKNYSDHDHEITSLRNRCSRIEKRVGMN
jgi:hypothetical protein